MAIYYNCKSYAKFCYSYCFYFRNKIMENFPCITEHISYFTSIHGEAEAWMKTCPRRYISFLQTFSDLLLNKQKSTNKRMAHLKVIIHYAEYFST